MSQKPVMDLLRVVQLEGAREEADHSRRCYYNALDSNRLHEELHHVNGITEAVTLSNTYHATRSCLGRLLSLCHSVSAASRRSDQLLHHLYSRSWSTGLRSENLATLIHDKNTPSRSLGRLLQPNGSDQGRTWIAQQWVWQFLLLFERSVGLRAIGAETVNAQAGRGERLVRIAEQACLCCACTHASVNCTTQRLLSLRLLTTRRAGLGVRKQHDASL